AQRPAGRLRAERLPAALAPLLGLPGGAALPPDGRDAQPLTSLSLGEYPRLPCTGAGAPSPLRFGAAGHRSGSDRPLRRLIGAPTAPPLPCCAVTDRGLPARAA